MGNGSLRFKDNSGNVISFISGSGTDIVISGGTLNLLGMTEVALGNVTISGSTLVNGTQGNQGPQGMNGFQGPTGLQGTTGSNGAQGNQGPTGLQGTTGAQGNQGPTGLQGNQGPTGLQGTTGSNGAQGNQGPTGLQGNQGPTGLQGFQGTQGTQGTTGASAGITGYTNPADNRVLTSVSSTSINAEANLTFDGTTLGVTGDFTSYGTFGSFGQLFIAGVTDNDKRLAIGYNTVLNTGFIQAMNNGVSYSPLVLNSTGGNVGIGTTSPSVPLHVEAGSNLARVRVQRAGTNIFGEIQQIGDGVNNGLSIQANDGNSEAPYIVFRTSTDGSTFSEKMRIINTGNVGIGATSPTARLHVKGIGTDDTTSALKVDDSGVRNLLNILNNGVATFSGLVNLTTITGTNTTFFSLGTGTGAGYSRMTIGTGNGGGQGELTIASNTGVAGEVSGATDYSMVLGTNSATALHLSTSEIVRATITSTGNVGIGTTSPLAPLQVSSPTGGAIRLQYGTNSGYGQIETSAANDLIFKTNGAAGINNRMTILETNGNVGIGATSPTSKLTVVGDIKATTLTLTNSKTRQNFANNPFVPLGKPRVLDLSEINAGLKGFIGGFTDGRYGYFVPYYNGAYNGLVARVDLNDFLSVTVLDLSETNAGLKGFYGGFTDGRYGYFVPHYNGAAYHGLVARIQLFNGGNL